MAHPERKSSPRLPGFDYGKAGFYFITICTAQREPRFGAITNGEMRLNPAGDIARDAWLDLPNHHPHLSLDEFVFMPNHMHGILVLEDPRRDRFINLSLQKPSVQKRHGLSEILRGHKTWSARRINALEDSAGAPVWQRSFYDHIIRDDGALQRIRAYIRDNPLKWELDRENPVNR